MSRLSQLLTCLVGAWLAGCGTPPNHGQETKAADGAAAVPDPGSSDTKVPELPSKNIVSEINCYKFTSRDGNSFLAVEVLHKEMEVDPDLSPWPFSGVALSNTGGPVDELLSLSRTIFYVWGAGRDFTLVNIILRTKTGTVYRVSDFNGIKSNVDLKSSIHYDTLPIYSTPTI